MQPIIIENNYILDLQSAIAGFKVDGVSLWPFIFIRKGIYSPSLLNHEMVHHKQAEELLVIGFKILYLSFYLWNRWIRGMSNNEAYRNNPFELEAYDNEINSSYHITRKPYSWIKYLGT